MAEYKVGHVYAVDILGTLLATGGKIMPISQRVLGLDRPKLDLPQETERAYFELLGPYIVPNPIHVYGDTHARKRGQGPQNLFQGDEHMIARFKAIDNMIANSTEEHLLIGVEKVFGGNQFHDTGHTEKAYVRLLPRLQREELAALLLDVERSQNAISQQLSAVEFANHPAGYH